MSQILKTVLLVEQRPGSRMLPFRPDPLSSMSPPPSTEVDSRKRLMGLMTRHQRQIFAYIYTLVPDRHDAEDLLQETSVVICENFVAWACQIAWWRIRYSRQKFARSKVIFDDDVLESVAHTATTMREELDERHEA